MLLAVPGFGDGTIVHDDAAAASDDIASTATITVGTNIRLGRFTNPNIGPPSFFRRPPAALPSRTYG
jgi:hypothetical protein